MKTTSIIALLLALLLCFAGCEKSGPVDEETKADETTAEETKGEETNGNDTKVEIPAAGEYTAYIETSIIEGDGKITLNEDKSFSITIDTDDALGMENLKAQHLFTGNYTVDNGIVTCTSGRASFTLSSDDAEAVLTELKSMGAPNSMVSLIENSIKNGTSMTEEDIGAIPYEKTVFNFTYENGKLIIRSCEEWYGDSEYAHFICVYEEGVIYTKTLYDRSGGITYVDYYVDGKLDHTDNYDIYGNPIN